jgi:putative ABC transport system permease protein
MALTLAGLALGLGIALALARGVSSMSTELLAGVSSTDPQIYCAAALFLAAIAALASYIPARGAARVDPMVSLRHQ